MYLFFFHAKSSWHVTIQKTFPKSQYSQAVNEFLTHRPTSTSFSYDIFYYVYFGAKVFK